MNKPANNSFKTLAVVSVVSVGFCLVLMGLRVLSAASFSEALHLITSGWEQGPLFSVWKAMSGDAVYADRYKLPFAVSYYNWLFYKSYGWFAGFVLGAFGLADAWLPTAARLFTAIGMALGAAVCYASFVVVAKIEDRWVKLLALSFALFVFFGPLVGFWGFTVRPEVWSLALECLVVLAFWRLYPRWPLQAAIICAVIAYLAWSFKQGNVFSTVTVGLFLLYRRDWKAVFLFSGLLITGYVATFIIGGQVYLDSLFQTGRLGFDASLALRNLVNFALKSAPVLAALGVLGVVFARSKARRRALFENESVAFALIGLLVSVAITLPLTAKVGAAENYYFIVSYFICLVVLCGYGTLSRGGENAAPLVIGASIFGWGANVVAVGVVLFGLQGVLSVADQHETNIKTQACLEGLQKPVFIDNQYASLPWMNTSKPIIFLSWNYTVAESGKNAAFERGGVGGMIEDSFFAALALNGEAQSEYDGGSLDAYRPRPGLCAGMTVYQRKTP
jgi:hypothetical protein